MRIAIPILAFSCSGGHRVISKLSNEWIKMGHSVEMIVSINSKPYYPMNEKIKITYVCGKNIFQNFKKITAYIHKHYDEYDIILANQNRTAFFTYYGVKEYHDFSKCFYYIQAYEPDFYQFCINSPLDNWKKIHAWYSYFLPLKKIVNSEIYMNYKNIRTNKVVHPGLDLKIYYNKDVTYFNDVLKVGCIGRTDRWKGTQDVCDAIKILKNMGRKIDFYIAFNDYNTVEHYFVKPDGDENLAQFYREMDVIVAPAYKQLGGIHYPVIEAMACGTNIITTNYYPADVSNAYIVPVRSPEKIAKAIIEIMKDKEKAIKKRKKALNNIKNFEWKVLAKKFEDYFNQATKFPISKS